MELKKIDSFGAQDTHLTLSKRVLDHEVAGAPLAQYEFGSYYLLVLPDDPWEGGLLYILVLNKNLKRVEHHSAPQKDQTLQVYDTRFETLAKDTLQIDAGAGHRWTVQISVPPRFRPVTTFRLMLQGWFALWEYPQLVRRTYLRIQPR